VTLAPPPWTPSAEPVREVDVLVAGGGASGLSLTAHLVDAARRAGMRQPSVLVVDDARHPLDERLWASWSRGHGLLDAAVSRSWDTVTVHTGDGVRTLPLGPYRYRAVRGRDLRRAVTDVVGDPDHRDPELSRPNHSDREHRAGPGSVRWLRDTVLGARVGRGYVDVTLREGPQVRARWVFDSTMTPPPGPVPAEMAFLGWEVETDRPHGQDIPVFMDFRTPSLPGTLAFVYLLPLGDHRLLAEYTALRGTADPRAWTAPSRPDPHTGHHEQALREYLDDVVRAGDYRVRRTEHGVLPLGTTPRRTVRSAVIPIGTPAGMIKASTGYAYRRIQKDSALLASAFVRGRGPFATAGENSGGGGRGTPERSPSGRWHASGDALRTRLGGRRHPQLDRVLLEVIRREPAALQRVFHGLLRPEHIGDVLAFLDEETGLRQERRLLGAVPGGPFLAALPAALRRR